MGVVQILVKGRPYDPPTAEREQVAVPAFDRPRAAAEAGAIMHYEENAIIHLDCLLDLRLPVGP